MRGCIKSTFRDFMIDDKFQSSSWKGVIQQSSLEEHFKNTIPVKVHDKTWYSSPEGLALLRKIDSELKSSFDICQMSRDRNTENIYFTLYMEEDIWQIEMPDDFPGSHVNIKINGKSFNLGYQKQFLSSDVLKTTKACMKYYYSKRRI